MRYFRPFLCMLKYLACSTNAGIDIIKYTSIGNHGQYLSMGISRQSSYLVQSSFENLIRYCLDI